MEAPKFTHAPWTRHIVKLLQSPYFFSIGHVLHHLYPQAFCTLPSFTRIKGPRSTSTIAQKNKGLWTIYYSIWVIVLSCTVLYCFVLCYAVFYSTVLYYTVPCFAILFQCHYSCKFLIVMWHECSWILVIFKEGGGGRKRSKSPFSLLSEPISPSSLNSYVSFSPSSQLFLVHFSLLPILFLPPL